MSKYVVRYGAMRLLGICTSQNGTPLAHDTPVIVRTDRGLEVGAVLRPSDEEETEALKEAKRGQILRVMSPDDIREIARIHEQERDEFQVCTGCIEKLGLEMRLVKVEHIFGGERILVYYLADGRVDFRELVKMLAGEFQTRIEMRQIGVRDEAKLMADYGDCGKPVCCNSHLISMPPVSMKMAKMQKATLDPTKISGRCGRLKCCLRYEFDTYEELQKLLPSVGSTVQTAAGDFRIIGQEILAGKLFVEGPDRTRRLIDAGELTGSTLDKPAEDVTEGAGSGSGGGCGCGRQRCGSRGTGCPDLPNDLQ